MRAMMPSWPRGAKGVFVRVLYLDEGHADVIVM